MINDIFLELSILILITVFICFIISFLKQPLIIGYILTGILVGPFFLGIISPSEYLSSLASMGVALLLFLVGLNLNPKGLKEVGKIALFVGIGQVLFTTIIGYLILVYLGFSQLTSLYLAVGLAFSSTIIITKILSDKGNLESLYGKISIGFLIVQDFIAIAILLILAAVFGSDKHTPIIETFLKGAGLLLFSFLFGNYVLPKMTNIVAKSQEFLMVFSLGWCLALSTLFDLAGFSIEIGALLAGITLAMSPYRFEIISRMRPLRDFFLILFFIFLGSQMAFGSILSNLLKIIILSLFVLIGNPLIVLIIMGIFGYTKRTGFLVGCVVAQISEFSIILVTLGVKLKQIPQESIYIITAVGIITITFSTYLVTYSEKIYSLISRYLIIFEKRGINSERYQINKNKKYEVILFGHNRIGYSILEYFKKKKNKILVIDYNPDIINTLIKNKQDCIYGDAGDQELLNEINFENSKMVISSIPDAESNTLLIDHVKQINKKAIVIVLSHQLDDALDLYNKGADYVIMPHLLGGHYATHLIDKYEFDINKFLKERTAHIKMIKKRKQMGQEHPANQKP